MMETKMFTRKELIGETKVNVTEQPIDVLTIARAVARARTLEGDDAAFMIVNLDALRERVQLWQRELPQIEPFYAVKCNSDETLLQSLAALDVGFDCASREEIVTIRRMGVSPDRIIYAHPCKAPGQIEHADVAGVRMMTFDSVEELQKIAAHHERPQLILRIAVSDPTATHPLAFKFGADPIKLAPKLLEIAANIGVNVVGISFHVGCGCNDPSTYRTALQLTRNLFDIGIALGHKMEIVDIGGGFPGGERHKPFEKFSAIIRTAVADFFPEPSVRVIAEPGRFFAARSCTIVLSVMARRAVPADKITMNPSDAASTGYMYYVNDGAYGSFNCIKYDHVRTIGRPLFDKEGKQYPSTIWGPTCDSGDKIEENKMMRAVEVGDWLIYEDMGAYTCAASSTFNGFPRPTPIHVISERTWYTDTAEMLFCGGGNEAAHFWQLYAMAVVTVLFLIAFALGIIGLVSTEKRGFYRLPTVASAAIFVFLYVVLLVFWTRALLLIKIEMTTVHPFYSRGYVFSLFISITGVVLLIAWPAHAACTMMRMRREMMARAACIPLPPSEKSMTKEYIQYPIYYC